MENWSADHLVFLALDPFVNSRGSKPPEFPYLNPDNLTPKDHTLERSGMNSQHGSGDVAVEERLDTGPPRHWQAAFGCWRLFLVIHG
jgi:hypothetical protein